MTEPNKSPLPRYRSRKAAIVEAARIIDVETPLEGPASLLVALPNGAATTVEVSLDYVAKHAPEAGGYYVRYQDGYESWSPAAEFERGYTLEEN